MCKNTEPTGAEQLKVEDEWIKDFDVEGFTAEIKALGDRLERGQGKDDYNHLCKMIAWSNMCAAVGFFTMGFSVNIVSIFALSTWTCTRWTMIHTTPAMADTTGSTPTRAGGTASSSA